MTRNPKAETRRNPKVEEETTSDRIGPLIQFMPTQPVIAQALPRPELPDPVAAEVESNGMGSGGEHVEKLLILPTRTTRSGRTSRPPRSDRVENRSKRK